MQPAKAQTCRSMEILRSRLHADVRVYMQAVQHLEAIALGRSTDNSFVKATHDVEVARVAFAAARKRLNEHIAAHGCM